MAKGLSIGVRVKAKATKILSARQEFGKQASKVEMRSEIVKKEGAGPAIQWVVRWDKPLCESAWNTRSLTCEDDNEANKKLINVQPGFFRLVFNKNTSI